MALSRYNHLVAPPAAARIHVSPDEISVFDLDQQPLGTLRPSADGAGTVIHLKAPPAPYVTLLPPVPTPGVAVDGQPPMPPPSAKVQKAVDRAQTDLLHNVSRALNLTMRRVGWSLLWFQIMNITLFVIGVAGVLAAGYTGLRDPGNADVATTAVFLGMGVSAFLGYFLTQPRKMIAETGPQAAWMISTTNTYWTKLIYLNNPDTFAHDIEAAQHSLERSMLLYFTQFPNGSKKPKKDKKSTEDNDTAGTGQNARPRGPRMPRPGHGSSRPGHQRNHRFGSRTRTTLKTAPSGGTAGGGSQVKSEKSTRSTSEPKKATQRHVTGNGAG